MRVLDIWNLTQEQVDEVVMQAASDHPGERARGYLVGEFICRGVWGTVVDGRDAEVAWWIVADDAIPDSAISLQSDSLFHVSRATLGRRTTGSRVTVFDDVTGEFLIEMSLGHVAEPYRATRETPLATGRLSRGGQPGPPEAPAGRRTGERAD